MEDPKYDGRGKESGSRVARTAQRELALFQSSHPPYKEAREQVSRLVVDGVTHLRPISGGTESRGYTQRGENTTPSRDRDQRNGRETKKPSNHT